MSRIKHFLKPANRWISTTNHGALHHLSSLHSAILKGKVLDSELEGNVRANSVLDENDQRPWSIAHNGDKFTLVLTKEIENVEQRHRSASCSHLQDLVFKLHWVLLEGTYSAHEKSPAYGSKTSHRWSPPAKWNYQTIGVNVSRN